MSEVSDEQVFLGILNNILDLMSNLSEGDYLKGAEMCKDMNKLVKTMKTNTLYVRMMKDKVEGMTNQQKLASGRWRVCADCGLLVQKTEKAEIKHSRCKTHIRAKFRERLSRKGLPQERIDDLIRIKTKIIDINNSCEYILVRRAVARFQEIQAHIKTACILFPEIKIHNGKLTVTWKSNRVYHSDGSFTLQPIMSWDE